MFFPDFENTPEIAQPDGILISPSFGGMASLPNQ
jgi:hypothetical protein